MPRPILATIHTAALRHNLQCVRTAAPTVRVLAVVKADGYGHGIERVFDGLRDADGFAVLDLCEAERLRALGWRGPVLLLEGVFQPSDLAICSRLHLWHTVHDDAQIDMLTAQTATSASPHSVFLKMNSGMNRLGFAPGAYRQAFSRLRALAQVARVSLMTHFGDADRRTGIDQPLALFAATCRDLPGDWSVCNSAAILCHPDAVTVPTPASASASNWVRPGICLYGSSPDYPSHTAADWGLQPAMSLSSTIIATQDLPVGAAVGYGQTFRAAVPMRIGVVACGYADGYPRACPSGTPVLVDGQRTQVVGRVSMDMITVDLTGLPTAGTGSAVTLWGRAACGAVLDIDEVACAGGTLGYELMCALPPRVPVQVTSR